MRACPGLASRHRVVVMFAGCATSVLALYTMDIVGCGAIVVQSIYTSVCGFSTFSCWIMEGVHNSFLPVFWQCY